MNRARVLQWMREMATEREARGAIMVRNNSTVLGPGGFTQKGSADSADYSDRVAVPTMEAVDSLPPPYRAAINDHGYVDVYRAWLRRLPVSRVREQAERHGGLFVL